MEEKWEYYFSTPSDSAKALGIWVNSAGRFESRVHEVVPRIRPDYELVYCTEGSGTARVGDLSSGVGAGDIFVFPPGIVHSCECDPISGWDIRWVHFEGAYASSLAEMFALRPAQPVHQVGVRGQISTVFDEILIRMRDKAADHELDLSGLMFRLLIEVRKAIGAGALPQRTFLNRVDYRTQGVRELASRFGWSREHLIRSFKRATGVTAWQYIMRLKVDKAKELLAGTDLTIREIADTVGMDDPNYFSRMFARICGMTPSAFRSDHLHGRGGE